ncbi:hypothetical protein Ddye_001068 [Dipteronia dyeriana]|uniref:Uncharacterized protein n=1 Tax=Dipteronia dyeriana TaxID=168575 RepID=A0AAD9XMX3_9ROSI|nr:hypothetical protein Ddye_001068 [Dipteronia dyeriana]
MANGKDNLVYKHAEDNWFDARVSIYCKLSHLTIITEDMAKGGMLRWWEQSVFKQFFSLNTELFSGKFYHILLYRELNYSDARPDEMWFRIGHNVVKFGKEDFLIVIRLRGKEFDEVEDIIKLGYVYFLSHNAWSRVPLVGWKTEKRENEPGVAVIDEIVLPEETTTFGKKIH